MKVITIFLIFILTPLMLASQTGKSEKSRLVILADMGNEPDEVQQMVHMMMYNNEFTPIWRWRRAMYNDIKCRMDCCVSDFENANHPPVVAINGNTEEKIHYIENKQGEKLKLDASQSTDPDGNSISYNWWVYPEAGTYQGNVKLVNSTNPEMEITVPEDSKNTSIHLILEIKDNHKIASLFDYRRIVIKVS